MPLNRHFIAMALRRTGLLRQAYRAAFIADAARHALRNRSFSRTHPDFPVPPAKLLFETQSTTDILRYQLGGEERAQYVLRTAVEHLPQPTLRILEWGCGPARVIRHLPSLDSTRSVEAFGTDYSERLVAWCQRNVRDVSFAQNMLQPPLAFHAASFDMVYSFSVMTHLSPEVQKQWLDEHVRVVRPGGIIMFTVHGDSYRGRLVGEELTRYDSHGFVVRGAWHEGGPWYTTYQRPSHVERVLLSGLDVVHCVLQPDGAPPMQDVWVVRR